MKQYISVLLFIFFTYLVNAQETPLKKERASILLDSVINSSELEKKISIYSAEETRELVKKQPILGAFMEQNIGQGYINKGDRKNSTIWLTRTKGAPYAHDALWSSFYKKYNGDKDYQFIDQSLFGNMDSIYHVFKDYANFDAKLYAYCSPRLRYYVENKINLRDTTSALKFLDLIFARFKRFQDIKNYEQYVNLLSQIGRAEDAIDILAELYTSGRPFPQDFQEVRDKLVEKIPKGKLHYDEKVRKIRKNQRKNFQDLISKSEELYGINLKRAISKNKYILLSFWGTWCVPCIESHPKLLNLYKKYKNDGLEILSLASESGKDKNKMILDLKNSIKSQNLTWLHTMLIGANKSDHPYWQYQIEGYPTKILVDKDGVILGKFTGGAESESLELKLKEIFGK